MRPQPLIAVSDVEASSRAEGRSEDIIRAKELPDATSEEKTND
jgi:hypothetical protein